jgi:hypothetical protein
MEIDSPGYGGQEHPQYAIYKLENQDIWWCNPVQVQNSENSMGCWCKSPIPKTSEQGAQCSVTGEGGGPSYTQLQKRDRM